MAGFGHSRVRFILSAQGGEAAKSRLIIGDAGSLALDKYLVSLPYFELPNHWAADDSGGD
jgi:hypothetical protein